MSVCRRPAILMSLLAALMWIPACQGPATEDDLQLWTRNDRGLERLRQVIEDPNEPIDTKVRALEIVVEKGLPRRARPMIESATGDLRKQLVARYKVVLIKILEDPSKAKIAAYAKDTLLMMHRYMSKEEFVEIQQKVAKWAFTDITWKSTSEDVKKIGERISTGQITDLGKYALEGSAIVMSHGFKVDKMIEFLMKPPKKGGKKPLPEAEKHLLRAMKLLHQRIGAQKHHLDALAKIPGPDTAVYLYSLYLNPNIDEQLKNSAFNYADRMLSEKSVKESQAVVDSIFGLFTKSSDPDDRWTATNYLIKLHGTKHLEKALTFFKDDKQYNKGESDADRQTLDLCLDLYDRGHAIAARPIFRKLAAATNKNRITRALSLVCLKAHRDFSAIPMLETMLAKEWDPKPAKKGEEPPSGPDLDDYLGEKITMKGLVTNVIEGLKMLQSIKAEFDAKKLNDVEYEFKQRGVIFPLEVVGEEFTKRVTEDWANWQVQYKKNPKEFEDEVRNRGKQ